MALPKKPLTGEEIARREHQTQQPTVTLDDAAEALLEQGNPANGSPNPTSEVMGVDEDGNLTLPVSNPHAPQKRVFAPQRRVLEVNDGVNLQHTLRDDTEPKTVTTPKRTRYTTAALSSKDILENDYETSYKRIAPKVVEVLEWVQGALTEGEKNDEVASARKVRHSEKYEDMVAFLDNLMIRYFAESNVVSPRDKDYVVQSVINEILGLGPIEPLWNNPNISEIMVNGPFDIKVEIYGKIVDVPGAQFRDSDHLLQICQQILGDIGRRVDIQKPLANSRLGDGSRVNVVHPVIAPEGPYLTIRRFPDTTFTLEELVKRESMTQEMVEVVGNLVHKGVSLSISGGTGSGKTSMLNALSGAIPSGERVITIEDTLELRLSSKKHILSMEAKDDNSTGDSTGGVNIRQLVKNALRMRPDRIIVGEVRDSAAYDMLNAMNTGHDGSMTTVHANDAEGAVDRFVNLVAEGGDFDPERAISLIANGLDVIVSVDRFEDGSRRVSTVSEIPSQVTVKDGLVKLIPIPLWVFVHDETVKVLDEDGVEHEKVIGHYEKVNDLSENIVRKHRLDKKRTLSYDELVELGSIQ